MVWVGTDSQMETFFAGNLDEVSDIRLGMELYECNDDILVGADTGCF